MKTTKVFSTALFITVTLVLVSFVSGCSGKLSNAVVRRNYQAAENLIRQGVDVNKASIGTKWTPLMFAVREGDIEMVRLLLDNNASVNATNFQGCSPLHIAVKGNNVEIASLLIAEGADPASSREVNYSGIIGNVLFHAQSPEMIKLLIDNGADPNSQNRLGKTPLLNAVMTGNLVAVKSLVEYGADINMSDKGGVSPLIVAILYGDDELFSWLLELGAKVNTSININGSPLHAAAYSEHKDFARRLIEVGAKPADIGISAEAGLATAVTYKWSGDYLFSQEKYDEALEHYRLAQDHFDKALFRMDGTVGRIIQDYYVNIAYQDFSRDKMFSPYNYRLHSQIVVIIRRDDSDPFRFNETTYTAIRAVLEEKIEQSRKMLDETIKQIEAARNLAEARFGRDPRAEKASPLLAEKLCLVELEDHHKFWKRYCYAIDKHFEKPVRQLVSDRLYRALQESRIFREVIYTQPPDPADKGAERLVLRGRIVEFYGCPDNMALASSTEATVTLRAELVSSRDGRTWWEYYKKHEKKGPLAITGKTALGTLDKCMNEAVADLVKSLKTALSEM